MFKNILFGLGSVGVIGGGGYMIYNATRSGDDKSFGTLNGEVSDKNNTQTTTVPRDGEGETSKGGGTGQTEREGLGEEASGSGSSSDPSGTGSTK